MSSINKGHLHSWGIEAPPQPEEAILALFETQSTSPFTFGTMKQFFYRALFFALFLTALKFLLLEFIPSFLQIIGLVLIFSLITLLFMWYMSKLNDIARKKGIFGILSYVALFVGIIIIL